MKVEKEILYSRRLNDNPTTLEDLSKETKEARNQWKVKCIPFN